MLFLAQQVARNRLVQFAVIGCALFTLAPSPPSRRIEISREALSSMQAAHARRLGVAELTSEQAREVAMRALEDELLYREGLRLGLERDDPVIRQYLVNKVLFLAEDLAGTARPSSEQELRAHYEAHHERWRRPSAVRFVHVFASSAHREVLDALLPRLDKELRTGRADENAPPCGEAFPLPRDVPLSSEQAVASTYGDEFATAVTALAPNTWSSPIASNFGWHLVRVIERRDEEIPPYESVRGEVKVDVQRERKQRGIADYLARAQSHYRIDLGGQPVSSLDPAALPLPAAANAWEE